MKVENIKVEKSMLRKIAWKNTFDNRLTFCTILMTIVLAIGLITGLFLTQIGNKEAEEKILSQMQQVSIGNLSTSQVEEIQKDELVEELVPYKSSGEIAINDENVQAVYMPSSTNIMQTYNIVKGNAPLDKNEIAVNENFSKLLDKKLEMR